MKTSTMINRQSALLLMLLLSAIIRTNYGLWNADIPLGDEAGYIGQSFALSVKGALSGNLYFDIYSFLFRHVTLDPITAHYYLRFFSSTLSVAALFLLLSKLDEVRPFGAFVMALLWNLSVLTTPYVQRGNINLFTFSLVCLSGYAWIAAPGIKTRILSLGLLLAAIKIRPEYSLLLLLGIAYFSVRWTTTTIKNGWAKKNFYQVATLSVTIISITAIAIISETIRNTFFRQLSALDDYLFLGFQQCYTSFATARDPSLHLEPMTEYGIIISERFPGASGFIDALLVNPGEAGRYFVANGLQNIRAAYFSLLDYNSIFTPSESGNILLGFGNLIGDHPKLIRYERYLTLLVLISGNIYFVAGKLRQFVQRRLQFDDNSLYILGIAAVALVPILVHIADPRYWIMIVPLFYWGPAALLSDFSANFSGKGILCLAATISLACTSPVFTSKSNHIPNSDKEFVLALREKLHHIPSLRHPVHVVGIFPSPILEFTIPGKWKDTNNFDIRTKSVSYETSIMSRENDIVIIDEWLRTTQQYRSEHAFFDKFLHFPEDFGYELFMNAKKPDGQILLYCRKNH